MVLLTAFGLGLKQYIKGQFENLGTNLLMVMPGNILSEEGGFSSQSETVLTGANFDDRDVAKLKRVKDVAFVAPAFMKTVEFSGNGNWEIGDLYATTADIFTIRNLEASVGEVFSKNDVDKRSKKVVIGPKIAEKLFGSFEAAFGKNINIENTAFKVIGVLKSKGGGGLGGLDFDSFVYMPYTSTFAFNPEKKFFAINIKVAKEEAIPQVKEKINEILVKRYDKQDFSVVEQSEILSAVTSIFSVLNMVLIGIAAISLLVGGIGIMNIMYVSVIERTKEIGIRRAIGATGGDILFQFLLESVILSSLGGLFGLILSFLIITLIQKVFPAYINYISVLAALGVSSAIGILFGVLPARRAAKLTPVEAIRYE